MITVDRSMISFSQIGHRLPPFYVVDVVSNYTVLSYIFLLNALKYNNNYNNM